MYQHYNLILNDKGTLWLGDIDSAQDSEFLKKNGIRTVITVAAGLNLKFQGIMHHKIEILDIDTANIQKYFAVAIEWIERGFNIGGVLVHCMAGISRSAAIVIAYLIEKRKMTYSQAYTFVKCRRPQINPNKGFTNQLMQFASTATLPPVPRTVRTNNFQQNEYQVYPPPLGSRKTSAITITSDISFYKSITKSMSQSKKQK